MGGVLSNPLVESEKTSWVLPHNLGYIPKIREEQLKLLPNFGRQLQLCYEDRTVLGVKYQHWWVTDTNWIIEFDGDENDGNKVRVHCNPRTGYTIDCSFQLTPDVMDRMEKVCGASNYSLALRNCEHLARYIHCGAWISFQMVGSGPLKNCFLSYMSTFTTRINTFPEELRPEEQAHVVLYPDAPDDIVMYSNSKDVLTEQDKQAYNIVILGPTGSGKSTLLNNVFNLTVCKAENTVYSVTRQVKFYQGSFSWKITGSKREMKKVNIIDTLGFCDSQLSPSAVLDAIKSSVKVNLTYLDKIVIVCSGRIEEAHSNAILQFIKWLNFSSYKDKFVFVYNKSDGQALHTKTANLAAMCELFGASTNQVNTWVDLPEDGGAKSSIRMNLTTGFPPGASYDMIKDDHTALLRAILCTGIAGPNRSKRVPVSKDSCTIL